MNKKLIAVAVAGALAAPVLAFAQSSVTIYGRANLGLETWRATGSRAAVTDFNSRNRVYDSASRVGFRGTEDLGGGLRAYFVIETGINMDTGGSTGQSGAVNPNANGWATRDSFVGLAGKEWGEVSFGRQSMFWANGLNEQTGANYINASVAGILTGHGMVAPPAARQPNVLYYTSPRLGGMWDIALGYSPTSEAATAGTGAQGTPSVDGDQVWNLNVKFRTGPWYAQYDWADRTNNTAPIGGGGARRVKGAKLGASYGYATGSRVGVIYQELRNNNVLAGIGNTVVAGNNIRVPMWVFNVEHSIGPWQLLGGYAQAASVRGATGLDTSNTKVNAWHLGAKYNFSKRTGIYASYNAIRNAANAFADHSAGGYSSAGGLGITAANEGADPKMLSFGMMHNF